MLYSHNDIFNTGYVAGSLGLSLCHYVLALSSFLWGISVITPLPLGEGRGGGASLWVCHFFLFYIVCLQLFYEYSFFSHFFYLILYPIIKEIRTINRKILRTKHLLNWSAQFLLFEITIVTVSRLFIFAHSFLCGVTVIVVSLQTIHCL